MIRPLGLLALIALITVGPTKHMTTESVFSSHATPAAIADLLPSPHARGDGSGAGGSRRDPQADAVPVSLQIRNDGDDDDRLLGGSTPVARRIDVHHTRLVDGRRQMQPVPDGLTIPAHGTLLLEPGASHLMLIGLRTDLVQGETFPITLRFARAGVVTVTARVRRRVDAAGLTPIPAVVTGELSLALASAPPAPAGTSSPEHDRSLD